MKTNKYALFSFFTIILGWNHLKANLGFNQKPILPNEHLVIASYNTHYLSTLLHESDSINQINQYKFVENWKKIKTKIDIFATQELSKNKKNLFKKIMDFPHYVGHSKLGVALYSQHPIINKGELNFENSSNSSVWADIKLPNSDTIRVYSIHLESTQISTQADRLRDQVDFAKHETYAEIRSVLGKYTRSTSKRINQIDKLIQHINTSKYPVILAGDFNDTPSSFAIRRISMGFEDHFKIMGQGWGSTYAGSIPLLRIDYILSSEGDFEIYQHAKILMPYSDHFPIYSRFNLK